MKGVEYIKYLMQVKGYTQARVALIMDLDFTVVSKLLSGKRELKASELINFIEATGGVIKIHNPDKKLCIELKQPLL